MLEINDYESAIKRGQEAWARISRDTSWEEWQLVGVALEIGRQEAMNAAHVRKPIGAAYNAAMSAWLTKTGFDKIDKGDRSRLLKVMTNIDAITTWRQTLTLTERLNLNHPSSVLRKWKPKAGPRSTREGQRQDLKNRDGPVEATDKAADIADWLTRSLTEPKLRQVIEKCQEFLVARRGGEGDG